MNGSIHLYSVTFTLKGNVDLGAPYYSSTNLVFAKDASEATERVEENYEDVQEINEIKILYGCVNDAIGWPNDNEAN